MTAIDRLTARLWNLAVIAVAYTALYYGFGEENAKWITLAIYLAGMSADICETRNQ